MLLSFFLQTYATIDGMALLFLKQSAQIEIGF